MCVTFSGGWLHGDWQECAQSFLFTVWTDPADPAMGRAGAPTLYRTGMCACLFARVGAAHSSPHAHGRLVCYYVLWPTAALDPLDRILGGRTLHGPGLGDLHLWLSSLMQALGAQHCLPCSELASHHKSGPPVLVARNGCRVQGWLTVEVSWPRHRGEVSKGTRERRATIWCGP